MDSSISITPAATAQEPQAPLPVSSTGNWRVEPVESLHSLEIARHGERPSHRPSLSPRRPLRERLRRLLTTVLGAAALLATLWVLAVRLGGLEIPLRAFGATSHVTAEIEPVLVLEPILIEPETVTSDR